MELGCQFGLGLYAKSKRWKNAPGEYAARDSDSAHSIAKARTAESAKKIRQRNVPTLAPTSA